MLEIVCRERANPLAQAFGEKLFKLIFQFPAGPVILEARSFIYQCNDAHLCKPANQNFSFDSNGQLIRRKLLGISSFQINLTDIRQKVCPVRGCPNSSQSDESESLAPLNNFVGNKGSDSLSLKNSR